MTSLLEPKKSDEPPLFVSWPVEVAGKTVDTSKKQSIRKRLRPRRLLRSLVVIVVLVIVGCGGYLFLSYAMRTHPGAKSISSAVNSFKGGSAQQSGTYRYPPPAQGVYELSGTGQERISFPPNSQADGSTMPASVKYLSRGCWRWHLDYNVVHWEEYDFCADRAQLSLTGNRNSQSWDYGTLTVNNLATFSCKTRPPMLSGNPVAGRTDEWSCTGANSAISGTTLAKVSSRVVGWDSLKIGREAVTAVHEEQTTALSGGQKGTVLENWWFSASTGLPLRVDRKITILTDSPLGAITYTESGSWKLVSAKPRS